MDLVIGNKQITAPILNILNQVKKECKKDVFCQVNDKGLYLQVTCPFHSDGKEKHPSCSIYKSYDGDVLPGTCHCFTCDAKMPIWSWVGRCFDEDDDYGKEWLCERFADVFVERQEFLPEINIDRLSNTYLDESILDKYRYYHPYMYKRKLSNKVIERFDIGWDEKSNALTFPFRDIHGNLLGISERSVLSKAFYIPANIEKPVYLLDAVMHDGYDTTIVCESQLDALYSWSLGYAAVALIGTGASNQYEILNKCSVRHYVLMFDGDAAGRNGSKKFFKNIRDDVIIDNIILPEGKDINDLSPSEFKDILIKNDVESDLRLVDLC